MIGDFTTLDRVKSWRSPQLTGTVDDGILSREINAASEAIRNYVQRDLNVESYVETRNGDGTSGLMLYQNPVVDVTGVVVNGTPILPPNTVNSVGYVVDKRKGMLYLRGFAFPQGFQNVLINYRAGYQTSVKKRPTTGARVQTRDLALLWNLDVSVTYAANGVFLTPVDADPGVGEYVAPLDTGGYYQFNAAESDVLFAITYSYTPRDVEEACISLVILEYNRRNRIGENSKSLASESVSYYNQDAFPKTVSERLDNYVNVVPIV